MATLDRTDGLSALAPVSPISASNAYRAYVLFLIWLVLLFRIVDLQIIAVLMEGIRKEFSISDTQLGFLTGVAFAVFYGTLGIPVAWLADHGNRRNIIVVALSLWSFMTALCGTVTSFAGLFLARMAVGVGEAGGTPPSYSLIYDYFSERRRATIFAMLNSSVPAGVFVGLLMGGYVNATFGWRAAFVVAGAPGLLVAALIALTLREPARRKPAVPDVNARPALGKSLKYLLTVRSYRHLVLGSSLFTLGALGSGIWIPSFFVRVHGMTMADASTWLAFIYGGGGLLGVLLGGHIADSAAKRTGDKRWYAWLPAVTTVAIMPFAFFVYLWPGAMAALLMQTGTTILMHMWMGPIYGTVQGLAGASRRATAAALNMLAVNLIGYALGPLLVGLASDFFSPLVGSESLRYSLLTVVVVAYAWAAAHFFLAAKTLRQDLLRAEGGTSAEAVSR